MAFIIWPLFLSMPMLLARAGPLPTTSLSPDITRIVPSCAISCLQNFVAVNYPTDLCSSQNFNCLCQSSSTDGYTLGEGALTCLVARCLEQDDVHRYAVYDICQNIPGALPNTHSTLIANWPSAPTGAVDPSYTAPSTSATVASTSSTIPSLSTTLPSPPSTALASSTDSGLRTSASRASSKIEQNQTSHTGLMASATTAPSMITTSSQVASGAPSSPARTAQEPSSTHTAAAAGNTSAAAPAPVLTKPQVAGIIVASVGAALVAAGLCLLLVCFRCRKARRRNSDTSMIGDKVMNTRESTPDMQAIAARDFGTRGRATRSSHGGAQAWVQTTHAEPHNVGPAVNPRRSTSVAEEPSPRTPRSPRITSQLLPEKSIRQSYTIFPPKPRTPVTGPRSSQRISHNHANPMQVYEPGRSPPMNGPNFPSSHDTSQADLQGDSRQRSLSDPFYEPRTASYRGVSMIPEPLVPAQRTPSHEYRPSTHQPTHTVSLRTQQPSLPRTHPPPPTVDQHYLEAIDRSHSQRRPRRNTSTHSSQYTRFSEGSDITTFEEGDELEPIPPLPQQRHALSPVAEMRTTPRALASVLYPAVPKTAAEDHRRIIDRPRPPSRKQSLASKRRGSQKAAELEGGFKPGDVRKTAKYRILVSPGIQSLDGSISGSPHFDQSYGGRIPSSRPPGSPPTRY